MLYHEKRLIHFVENHSNNEHLKSRYSPKIVFFCKTVSNYTLQYDFYKKNTLFNQILQNVSLRANAEEDSVVLLFKAMDRVISRLTSTFYKNINDFETENEFDKEADYNNSTTAMLSQSQQRKMSGIVLAGLKMNGKYRKRKLKNERKHEKKIKIKEPKSCQQKYHNNISFFFKITRNSLCQKLSL